MQPSLPTMIKACLHPLRRHSRLLLATLCLAMAYANASGEVPTGSLAEAKKYYQDLAKTLQFPVSNPAAIEQTTLTDLAVYLGFPNLTAHDLEFLAPADLAARGQSAGVPPDDVLVTRFFAPKIMNIKDPEATRKLGWRKLVRLRAQPNSAAHQNKVAAAVILFNIVTAPDSTAAPFGPNDVSFNTQVMLMSDPASIRPLPPQRNKDADRDTVYWLDYDSSNNGGKLAFALNASFDANELLTGSNRDYFVPHGCAACHGNNSQRSLLNYLDTDHWFDRLKTDFPKLQAGGLPLLVDAGTNDPDSPAYQAAFDVIRRFNAEADQQAAQAQPGHDETLAADKWLKLHVTDGRPLPPLQRAIGPAPQWSPAETDVLGALDQYCFRCHGTIKFSVYNRQSLRDRWPNVLERLAPDAPPGVRMPTDRELAAEVRALLQNFHP